jgi:hypothetical protein
MLNLQGELRNTTKDFEGDIDSLESLSSVKLQAMSAKSCSRLWVVLRKLTTSNKLCPNRCKTERNRKWCWKLSSRGDSRDVVSHAPRVGRGLMSRAIIVGSI